MHGNLIIKILKIEYTLTRKKKGILSMKYVKTTLDKLKRGQEAIVLEININERKRKKHLLDMGLTRGVKVKIKKIAPMGDPVSIELRDYELCVSKKELSQIIVGVEMR